MPVWDLRCACGWERPDTYVVGPLPVCPDCGGATEKMWRGQFPGIVDDTIHETIENLEAQPVTFTSRTRKKEYLASRGIQPRVRHIGEQGSDKSPHTTKWDAIPIDEASRLQRWHEHEAAL